MSHLARLLAALDDERAALTAEDARLRALPLPARAAAGYTLYPLDLVTTEHRSRGRVNVLLRGRDLHDGITAGEPVRLAPIGRPDDGWSGRCEGIDAGTIELRVDGVPEGKGPWAVSKRLDFTGMDLQAQALRRAEAAWSPLKNLLLGFEKPYDPDPLDHPLLARLNPDQRAAAARALGATELGLLHGPPGTGKTETLVAMLEALVELGDRPWALADSNAAVDHLALRAVARGLDVVRLGVSARVGTDAAHLTLEHRILNGPRAAVIHGLIRQSTRAQGEALGEVHAAIREEWQAAKREILAGAQVIAMTLGTLHTRGEDLPAPRTAVVDEAGQVTEPAVWLLALRVKRLILCGDPLQLGPVVKSRNPLLERPLIARLVAEGFRFPMLTEQYRMNAAVLPSVNPTYGGRLTTPPAVAARTVADLGLTPGDWTSPALRFVDTSSTGADEEVDPLGSFHNPGELRLLERVVASLRASGMKPEHVGIVTPYAAQLARIRAAFPDLEAGTVNAFQGREKEIVLASWVRSNPDGELGFVADARRLNVALSRARVLSIGIGDASTLGRSPEFARYFDAVEAGGGYTSAWEFME